MTDKKKKILLISWDSADWKIINKLIDKGDMPAMESLVDQGIMGNLQTIEPTIPPVLWSTVATGKYADKHGVLGFAETVQDKKKVRPISVTSIKSKSIWNILMHKNYKVHTVCWSPSHPAESLNGISLSDHYLYISEPFGEKELMTQNCIHPPEKANLFTDLKTYKKDITKDEIASFIPSITNSIPKNDKKIELLTKILSECNTVHNAASWIMKNEDWDFLAVYQNALDQFSHEFMKYYPPKMEDIPQDKYELYNGVIDAAYKHQDKMLAEILALTNEDTYVVLISAHGFHSDHLRPKNYYEQTLKPSFQHRQHGIICIKGPGIKKDERVYGANILDITPTILSILDLPIGKDMDGKPLSDIFENKKELKQIPSWEEVEGECGIHEKKIKQDSLDSEFTLNNITDLSHNENLETTENITIDLVQRELDFNLATTYLSSARLKQATSIFEKLYENYPKESRFGIKLASCYRRTNKIEESKNIIAKIEEQENTIIIENEENINNIKEKFTLNNTLSDNDYKVIKKYEQAKSFLNTLAKLKGEFLFFENKTQEALDIFHALDNKETKQIDIKLQLGKLYSKLKKWNFAEKYYHEALEIDPQSASALYGIGMSYFAQKNWSSAIYYLQQSTGIIFFSPTTHLNLAKAFVSIEEYIKAEQAFLTCLQQDPKMGIARNLLIELYENKLDMPENAEQQRAYFTKHTRIKTKETPIKDLKDPICIVSGLQRSGTSMMMQMLEAGGKDVFIDNIRKADENNPRGYYEHEAARNLTINKNWLKELDNKAVKVISKLLTTLPYKHNYKIIYMKRNITEVVTSQQQMLIRNKKVQSKAYPLGLEQAFIKSLDKIKLWAQQSHNVEILYVNYKDVIENPSAQAIRVNKFLNEKLDINKMTDIVDKELYRVKLDK